MKLILKIEMNNAAFVDSNGDEAGRILLAFAEEIKNIGPRVCSQSGLLVHDEFPLRDLNGNTVGFAHVYEDDCTPADL